MQDKLKYAHGSKLFAASSPSGAKTAMQIAGILSWQADGGGVGRATAGGVGIH